MHKTRHSIQKQGTAYEQNGSTYTLVVNIMTRYVLHTIMSIY